MLKTVTVRTTLLAISCAMSVSAHAIADSPKKVNVPAGELASALQNLAEQSGVEFVYSTEQLKGVRTQGVHGELTTEKAVTKLLEGTKLKLTVHESGALLISDRNASGSANPESGSALSSHDLASERVRGEGQAGQEKKSFWNRFRLAQADQGSPAEPSSAGDNALSSDKNSEGSKITKLEEVIVTAQKREERLQDVPISISVLTGDNLDKSTVGGITEALSRVPGMTANTISTGGGTQIVSRGVTAGGPLFSGSSPTSYYLDSIPFGFVRQAIAPDANAYDLDRVEVLRGPQGTLYGASAQNGVVRVLTHDASLDEFELKARALTSHTEGGHDLSYRGDLAVNVPIVEGKLAVRAVLGYQELGGWIDRPNKEDANDGEITNMRLKVGAQPTDRLSIGASAWRSRADYGGPSTSFDNGMQNATRDEPISTDFDLYGLKLGYQLPWVSIASVTGYLEYTNASVADIGGFIPDFWSTDLFSSDVFSQEVTFTSAHGGPWRWSLGGMYRDAEDLQFQDLFFGTFRIPANDQIYTSRSFAVFGELTRSFLDGQLELTGGLRYFEDDVTSKDNFRLVQGSSKADALSPRVVLTWHPSHDLTAYASYAEGFRSGFPQSGLLLENAPQFPPLEPDTLHNYEIGVKGDLWDGRLSFETAVYYIDWQDVQQSLGVVAGEALLTIAQINGESASGVGVDFGVATRPIEGLELGVNFNWNDLTMDAEVISAGVVLFEKGDRLNSSPEYTIGAFSDYGFPIGASGYEGRFSASANYTSEMSAIPLAGDSILIARTSFAIGAPAHWTATLFVDNVTNEQGTPLKNTLFPDLLPWDTHVRPRTVGVQFEYRF